MGFSLYLRSNQALALRAQVRGYASIWEPSTYDYVNAGGNGTYQADPWQSKGGNTVNYWHVPSFSGGIPTGYNRQPGVHADLIRLTNSSGAVTGFAVRDWATATTSYYQHQSPVVVSQWFLTRVEDPRHNVVTYDYDAYDHVNRITDAAGRVATLTWQPSSTGLLTEINLTSGVSTRTWNFDYWFITGHVPRLMNVIYPVRSSDGFRPVVHLEYENASDNISDLFDPRGAQWHYTYNNVSSLGIAVISVYAPPSSPPAYYDYLHPDKLSYDGTNATTFNYVADAPNHKFTCTIQDPLAKLWKHEYEYGYAPTKSGVSGAYIVPNEWMGNPIHRVYDPICSDEYGSPATYSATYTWNYSDATLAQVIDRNGNKTDFTYDAGLNWGLPNRVRRWLSGTTYFDWLYGNYVTAGGVPRQVQSFVPIEAGQALPTRTVKYYNWIYDEIYMVDVDPVSDPYDGSYSKPTGLANQTNYLYNSQGELSETWSTGDTQHTVLSSFDAAGNPWTVTPPSGHSTQRIFDVWGNKTSETRPSPEGTTGYEYDESNRLVKTTFPDGAITRSEYDSCGNPTAQTKQDGTRIQTDYDCFGRPVEIIQPTGTTNLITLTSYNKRGERESTTNPRGWVTHYDVDDRGKVYQVRYPDGTNRQFGYDGTGNRRWAQNGRGQKIWSTFDGLNRLTYIDYPSSTDVSYSYFNGGQRKQMGDGTGTTNYFYDDAGRLTSTTNGFTAKTVSQTFVPGSSRRHTLSVGAQTWTFDYYASLLPKQIGQTLGDPVPMQYAYYDNDSIEHRDLNGTVRRTQYGYDTRGRLTSISHRTFPNPTQATEQELQYVYGPDGNLQQYNDIVVGNWTWNTTYQHDKADRLISEIRTGDGISTGLFSTQYQYDENGNRTQVVRNGTSYPYGTAGSNDQFTTGEGYNFSSYDNDGNPLTVTTPNGSMTLAYDEAGRVTSITGLGASTFRYDGDGRRVERHDAAGITRYVYDGDQVILETDGANVPKLYRLAGVGTIDASTGQQKYELESALGSALTVRNNAGTMVGRTEYDAYGIETYAAGTDRGRYRFAGAKGYVNDDATGMQLLGARYYLPALGRFLTQDPIGQQGGLNLYAYCGNSPLLNVDPTGNQGFQDIVNSVSNFAAGAGDHISAALWQASAFERGDFFGPLGAFSSFSPTSAFRQALGYDEKVDRSSTSYSAGVWSGVVWETLFGGAGGWESAGAKGVGKDFSHWIPDRFLKSSGSDFLRNTFGRSKFNGNYVSELFHVLSDPLYWGRTRGVSYKGVVRPNPAVQQLMRLPRVYVGAGVAAANGVRRSNP